MNGYAVYKVQTRSSIKDKQVKGKVPSPVSSLVGQKCSLKMKKFQKISLKFFNAASTLNFTALFVQFSICAICSYVYPPK